MFLYMASVISVSSPIIILAGPKLILQLISLLKQLLSVSRIGVAVMERLFH